MTRYASLFCGVLLLPVACGQQPEPSSHRAEGATPLADVDPADATAANPDAAAADPSPGPTPVSADPCARPAEAPAATDSIAAVVALINAMPKPLSLPCFLTALERPLRLEATLSNFSLQPANGDDSPRVFILQPGFVLSVVPSGQAASLLEMSELVTAARSVKGEIKFPVNEALVPFAPLTRVQAPAGGTRCTSFCHDGEAATGEPRYGGYGFESEALRPLPTTLLPFTSLKALASACAGDVKPRCGLLRALFQGGAVEAHFPPAMPTL